MCASFYASLAPTPTLAPRKCVRRSPSGKAITIAPRWSRTDRSAFLPLSPRVGAACGPALRAPGDSGSPPEILPVVFFPQGPGIHPNSHGASGDWLAAAAGSGAEQRLPGRRRVPARRRRARTSRPPGRIWLRRSPHEPRGRRSGRGSGGMFSRLAVLRLQSASSSASRRAGATMDEEADEGVDFTDASRHLEYLASATAGARSGGRA
jgi:hypothetical protein